VQRSANKMANALASLAATSALEAEEGMTILVCSCWVVPPDDVGSDKGVNMICVLKIDTENWRQPIIEYLKCIKLPTDPRHKIKIQRRALSFLYYNRTLYRRFFLGLWLRCLDLEKAKQAMMEAHSGVCGAHQSGPRLHDCIKRMGYYWSTMVLDCIDYAKRSDAYQFHANFIHQPPEPLYLIVASWPFEAWGLDVIGPITPKSSTSHSYILAAIDYFSEWAKIIPLREVKKENVVDFIRTHIIYRYGVSRYIITDNGKPFFNSLMTSLCEKFKFAQHTSSMYNAPANGLAEAFNKTFCSYSKRLSQSLNGIGMKD